MDFLDAFRPEKASKYTGMKKAWDYNYIHF